MLQYTELIQGQKKEDIFKKDLLPVRYFHIDVAFWKISFFYFSNSEYFSLLRTVPGHHTSS